MLQRLYHSFQLDLRALALLRILTSLVILLDLGIRLTDLKVFYTGEGTLPAEALKSFYYNWYSFSLHTLYEHPAFQIMLFMLSALFAVFLLIGFRTRLFTLLSWFMLMSLQVRNPLILQGGDDLLRLILFWGFFLPWGKSFSVDCKFLPTGSALNTKYISWAGAAFVLQICYVYGASAIQKGPEWNSQFTALYYTYHLDQIAYPLATYLSDFPMLLKWLTALAYYFELLVPFLLLAPTKNGKIRLIGIFAIIGFHLWNGFTLQVGLYFIIGIISVTGLLPALAMNNLIRILKPLQNVLNTLLNRAAAFLIRFRPTPIPLFHFVSSKLYQVKDIILIILIAYVMAWNWGNLPVTKKQLAGWIRDPGYLLGLQQNWNMFAPGVSKYDGWYIYEGITENNEIVDLQNPGNQPDYMKPASVVNTFKNDRWRKYGENYAKDQNRNIRPYLCKYLMKEWNDQFPGKKIRQVRIIYMLELTLPDYQKPKLEKLVLSVCY
ncbi:MAG: HTTM domain-containing protein [Bacteroidia bacterium]